jgi:DNA-binding response OmpR family regulator
MSNSTGVPSVAKARVLVVDDEVSVCSALARSLTLLGYSADAAASGTEALEMLERAAYDAMVLDIRMPGMDGIEVMQQACQMDPNLPIILLTGHASLDSAIAAVRSRAADYLLKPVGVYGVAAAIERALERVREGASKAPASERFLRVGPVTLDRERHEVCVVGVGDTGSIDVGLTSSESALLAQLMQSPDTVFSCRQLARTALGYDVSAIEAQSIVRPHISRLRGKLEPDPDQPHLIRTVSGRGYRFGLV